MTSAQNNIYTIDQNQNFLRCLAKGILNRVSANPFKLKDVEIYLPNRRTVKILQQEFANLSQNKVCITPKIKSIGFEDAEEFEINILTKTNEIVEIPKEISKYERLFILGDLIKNFDDKDYSFKNISSKQTLVLAFSLAELIDDCVKYDIDSIKGLGNILPEDLATHKQVSLEFLNYIFTEYPKILKVKNLVDPITKRNFFTSKIAEVYKADESSDNLVIIAGSTGTLPATRKLIKAISELKNGCVILPYIDLKINEDEWAYIDDNNQELNHQLALKNLLTELQIDRKDIKFFESYNNTPSYTKIASEVMKPIKFCKDWQGSKIDKAEINKIQIAELENATDEGKLIAILIKEAIYNNKTCALITENQKTINITKNYLNFFGENLDDSIGIHYSKTEEGKFLLNIAELISSGFKTVNLLELLKSPIWEFENDIDIAKHKKSVNDFECDFARKRNLKDIKSLHKRLSSNEKDNITYDYINKRYINKLFNIYNDIDGITYVSYKDLIDCFNSIVKTFLSDDRVEGINSEVLEYIGSLKNLKANSKISVREFFDELFSVFSRIKIHPINFTKPLVKVLAPVEARLLHFDRVIVADVNLGAFPKQSFSQWLNKPMKRDFGLPPEELNTSLSAHDFASYLQCAEVFITRSNYNDSKPTTPSPFVTRIKSYLESQNIEWQIDAEYLNILKNLELQGFEHKNFDRPMPTPPLEARKNNLSATSIEKIIKNPYYFYAHEILQLKKLKELEEPSERREYGKFVHDALEEFSNSHNLDESKIRISALNKVFAKHFEKHMEAGEAEALWILETNEISPWFVENEKQVVKNLSARKCEIRGTSNIEGLIITAVADRFDIDKQGNLNVIDYKTGTAPKEKSVKDLFSPQLLIELLIADKGGFGESGLKRADFNDIGNAIYYNISLSDSGPNITEINIFNKENMLDIVNEELKNLSDSLMHKDTPFLAFPDKDNLSDYDDYYHLARYEK